MDVPGDFAEQKDLMIRAARRAYDIRLQSGDGGNLSVRLPGTNTILIKASGCSFGDMTHEDIVAVGLDGELAADEARKPSREIATHLAVYHAREDITAIFHCHSPWSTAASLCFDSWPPVSLPQEMKIGRVEVLSLGVGHADSGVADAVRDFLSSRPDVKAFVQQRHGIFCMSSGIIKAEHDAELVEEAAQIAMLAKIGGAFSDNGKLL